MYVLKQDANMAYAWIHFDQLQHITTYKNTLQHIKTH